MRFRCLRQAASVFRIFGWRCHSNRWSFHFPYKHLHQNNKQSTSCDFVVRDSWEKDTTRFRTCKLVYHVYRLSLCLREVVYNAGDLSATEEVSAVETEGQKWAIYLLGDQAVLIVCQSNTYSNGELHFSLSWTVLLLTCEGFTPHVLHWSREFDAPNCLEIRRPQQYLGAAWNLTSFRLVTPSCSLGTNYSLRSYCRHDERVQGCLLADGEVLLDKPLWDLSHIY